MVYLVGDAEEQELSFKVSVTPFEREGSSICVLAHIYLDDCFLINNVSLLQGKKGVFISMYFYRTRKLDEKGKNVYQDICFPITKDFREKLNNVILQGFEQAKKKQKDVAREQAEWGAPIPEIQEQELQFR